VTPRGGAALGREVDLIGEGNAVRGREGLHLRTLRCPRRMSCLRPTAKDRSWRIVLKKSRGRLQSAFSGQIGAVRKS
jgi:hypothetical protein